MKIAYLDGPRLRRSLLAACEHAQRQRSDLNRINVFPVPDGDTGTNLALTVRAIADHLRANDARDVSGVAHEAAQGAVLGARGNCGMMLSHFLLGFAEEVRDRTRITTVEFGRAMQAGFEKLYESLESPVEGTILSVMRDAAGAATASGSQDFAVLVTHVVDEARDSLERTPEQLAVLKKAGVVDAGAKGFVSMLEGVLFFVEGITIEERDDVEIEEVGVSLIDYPTAEEQYRYCTEALVRGGGLPTQQEARAVLSEHGDSLIVIRSEDVLKVHIHTDEPEGVFDYLRSVGNLVTHKAEDMEIQHATAGRGGHITLARRPIAIVTDSAADLSEEIVRAHGMHVIPMSLVDGDKTYRDGVDMTATQFHEMLAGAAESLPTTSQPSPKAMLDAFAAAAEEGEEIVSVLVGSTLSGTISSAEVAAERFEDAPVTVVDSLGCSLLIGLLALKAAELGEVGKNAAEIADELARIRRQSGILFTVKTFDRLIASGRVSVGKALLGRFLGLKPILGLDPDGKVQAFGKAFGTERARPELLRLLAGQIPEGAEKVRFGIVYVGIPEIVDVVGAELRAIYGEHVEILSAPATPVISTHLGIGAWGVAFIVED